MALDRKLPKLDLYYRTQLWEEAVAVRPYRGELVPLSASAAKSLNVKRVVAWLAAYGQAYTWQLAEVLGVSTVMTNRVLKWLYEAGIVARGRPRVFNEGALPYFFQLIKSTPLKEWINGLSVEDWLFVTGGTHVTMGNHLKHNLMVGDLSLRAMRSLPEVACVYGEPFAAANRLVVGCDSYAIGDAVLVLKNGLRVVVELCSHNTEGLIPKVVRWAHVLGEGSLDELGLVILFLNAAPPSSYKLMHRYLVKAVNAGLVPEKLSVDGSYVSEWAINNAKASIMVADWVDWFLPAYEYTNGFYKLSATRKEGDGWAPVNILDLKFSPTDPDVWQAPMRQMNRMYSMPKFLVEEMGGSNTMDSVSGGGEESLVVPLSDASLGSESGEVLGSVGSLADLASIAGGGAGKVRGADSDEVAVDDIEIAPVKEGTGGIGSLADLASITGVGGDMRGAASDGVELLREDIEGSSLEKQSGAMSGGVGSLSDLAFMAEMAEVEEEPSVDIGVSGKMEGISEGVESLSDLASIAGVAEREEPSVTGDNVSSPEVVSGGVESLSDLASMAEMAEVEEEPLVDVGASEEVKGVSGDSGSLFDLASMAGVAGKPDEEPSADVGASEEVKGVSGDSGSLSDLASIAGGAAGKEEVDDTWSWSIHS